MFPWPSRRHRYCPSFYAALFPGMLPPLADITLASYLARGIDPITSSIRLVTVYDEGIIQPAQSVLESEDYRPDGYLFDEQEYERILELSCLQQK